ncbi:UNVERIFIED_CONTAM: hypothetical protein GTU68_023993 [Idotea baltica]|nr:hypothetical protein [Idotea baltica]
MKNIRNFSIIAHIDHGKSTLADRILDKTGAVSERERKEQLLDDMDVERERGITVKSRAVSLKYTSSKTNEEYTFNLIDTPGHVDFSYEVSRSLAACEGALLVVDAAQGVEAQTVANVYSAIDADLEILPVLNKVDLPTAEPEQVKREIEEIIGLDASDASMVSAKSGVGVDELLERIVEKIPAPLIFDSWFDAYRGVMIQVRVMQGTLRTGSRVRFIQSKAEYEVSELGIYTPFAEKVSELGVGQVGFVAANIKSIQDAKIGDTITEAKGGSAEALPGFSEVKPFVFCGLYPTDSEDYPNLREALEKLQLNDAALSFEPETSTALGFGFRCGYLGLLHMEIVQDRLEREFNLALVCTLPTVEYRLVLKTGEELLVENPAHFPEAGDIQEIYEPLVKGTVHVTQEFLGPVLMLCEEKRGSQVSLEILAGSRAIVVYELPLNEIVVDFYDKLKSSSKGYASFDYELVGERVADLVKLDIMVSGEVVDALGVILHREQSFYRGRAIVEKMKELIDRHMFDIPIQAAIGSRVIARSTVKALRKNVTAKCYGGDISRKRKLLEKQKAGKKRMKQVGSVRIPQEAFLAALKIDK